jgi:hypothetical protein
LWIRKARSGLTCEGSHCSVSQYFNTVASESSLLTALQESWTGEFGSKNMRHAIHENVLK